MINIPQITRKLSRIPDGELKDFAEMHKQDPYTFALAVSESIRRKDVRSAPRPEEQQPTVADQQLSAMTELPEDVGIAALPMSMNLASGGIVAFDDGGDVYSNEGRNKVATFDDALNVEGINDPHQRAFLKAIYSQESSSGKNTKTSNKGAVGGMQIIPTTFASVADKDMDIRNPFDNMRAGIRYASQGYDKSGGDPILAGAYYYGGPGGMKKAAKGIEVSDSSNPNAPTTIGYGKSIAKKMFQFLPMGSAQAESLPPVQTSSAVNAQPSQPKVVNGYEVDEFGIPGRRADAPRVQAPEPVDERSIFEKGATYAGIPQEFQRNFSNTLNAFGGGFGGAPRMARGIQSGAKALEEAVQATPEAVAAAAAAAQKIANTRIAKPVAQGIETLTQEAQALRKAAENTRLARALKGDTDAARAAQKSVDQSNETAKLLRQQAEAADLAKAAQVNRVNQAVNVPRIASGLNAAGAQTERSAFAATDPRRTDAKQIEALNTPAAQSSTEDMPREIQSLENRYPKKEDLTKKDEKEIIAEAKAFSPELKSRGFTNDDWLQFGLALMAGKSRYAFENIGNAGLSAVAGKKEREKEERAVLSKMMDKTDMTKVIERLRMEDPKLSYRDAYDIYSAGRTALEARNRGIDVKEKEALTDRIKVYQDGLEKIKLLGVIANSPKATPEQKQAYADALARLGPNPALQATGTQVAPAASTMPALPGAKIVGSRPA